MAQQTHLSEIDGWSEQWLELWYWVTKSGSLLGSQVYWE
jgi:hypothetical protein